MAYGHFHKNSSKYDRLMWARLALCRYVQRINNPTLRDRIDAKISQLSDRTETLRLTMIFAELNQ